MLPFLRTPLNAIRMGVKLTPGLNLLQGEYRAMVSGSMGKEAQAQAIGQATMGSLFLGMAAFAASSGAITGGGPSDPKLKAALMATGWQPYTGIECELYALVEWVREARNPVQAPLADRVRNHGGEQRQRLVDGSGMGWRADSLRVLQDRLERQLEEVAL